MPTPTDKNKKYRVIGVDGEGYFNTEIGSHCYDVFSAGSTTIHANGRHLDANEIVKVFRDKTLKSLSDGFHPLFIGYFYTYDITQMIRSLDNFQLTKIYESDDRTKHLDKKTTDPRYKRHPTFQQMVHIREGDDFSPDRYQIDFREGKSLTLRFPIPASLPAARRAGDTSKIDWTTATVQDVGTIFGSSFISALDAFKIEMSEEEAAALESGKANRAIDCGRRERIKTYDEIIGYNRLEISLIYRLMTRLLDTLTDVGVEITPHSDLSGVGSLAAKVLSIQAESEESGEASHIIPSYEIAETIGEDIYKIANSAFYGGWAETFRPGIRDEMYQYDITSAYPAVMKDLPSLKDAVPSTINTLKQARKATAVGTIVFVDITFYGASEYIGALPFRTVENNVLRPQIGRGVYLMTEVLAAEKAGLIAEIDFHQGWGITPVHSEKPFAYVERLFNERLRVGKKTVQGQMLKVIINSQYGKIAQSVGNPRYANPVHACLITAGARIQLLEAIGTHQLGLTALLATATDAVFFDTPHDSLDETPNKLGAWEREDFKKAFLLKPGIWGGVKASDDEWGGIYQDEPDEWDAKTRGIGYKSFIERLYDTVIPTLERFKEEKRWDEDFAFKTVNTFSMLTLGEAYSRNDLDNVGEFMTGEHGTPEMVRDLRFSLYPKRIDVRWYNTLLGFVSNTAIVVGDAANEIAVSQGRKSMIGAVEFDD